MNVFPKPLVCNEKSGKFIFDAAEKMYFVIDKDFGNHEFVEKSRELWKNFTAGKSCLEIIKTENHAGFASISKSPDGIGGKTETEYEYQVDASEQGLQIVYSKEVGLIHAFSTILQIIGPYSIKNKNFSIPCCVIFDKPALELRGIHLCVFPETSLLFLQKAIHLCGLLKYSHIVIEFWGMYRFEFMPEMGWADGFTKSEMKSLVADGRAFGIEFIPMFNHMGHATQSRFKAGKNVLLDNAPEYEEYFEPGGWTWNIKNPDVHDLLDSVRKELIEVFGEGEYFHIGCDEVYFLDGHDDGYDAEQNREFIDFVNSVSAKLKALGRKTIMWGDMFLDKEEFKFPYCSNTSHRCYEYEKNIKRLDPEICIDDWQYNIGKDLDGTVKFFVERRDKSKIILSPWDGYADVSSAANINGRCSLAKEHNLLGVIETTWNTIYKDNRDLIYAACQMWAEDDKYADERTWEAYKCIGMHNLRKLLPCNGCREKSGWYVNELFNEYK